MVAADDTKITSPSRTRMPDPNTRSVRSKSPVLKSPAQMASHIQQAWTSTSEPWRTRTIESPSISSAIHPSDGHSFSSIGESLKFMRAVN